LGGGGFGDTALGQSLDLGGHRERSEQGKGIRLLPGECTKTRTIAVLGTAQGGEESFEDDQGQRGEVGFKEWVRANGRGLSAEAKLAENRARGLRHFGTRGKECQGVRTKRGARQHRIQLSTISKNRHEQREDRQNTPRRIAYSRR